MKMRFVEFEGTPAEFEQVKHNFSFNKSSAGIAPTASAEDEGQPASKLSQEGLRDIVITALTRRGLPSTMATIFKALLKNPKGLSSEALAKELKITRAQLAGVLGAFGRRLSHTEGFPDSEDVWLAKREWRDGERRYVLTPLGREVLTSGRVKL